MVFLICDRSRVRRRRQQPLHLLTRQSTEDCDPRHRLLLAMNCELGLRHLHIDLLGQVGECSVRDIVSQENSNQWLKQLKSGSGKCVNVLDLSHISRTRI